MEPLKVPGRATTKRAPEPGLADFVQITVKHSIEVRMAQRGGEQEFERLHDLDPHDLVEIEFDNNLRQWISVAQLLEDLRKMPRARGTVEDPELELPVTFGVEGQTRSIGGVIRFFTVSAFEHIKDKVVDKAVDRAFEPATRAAATAIIDSIESKLKDGPGLYSFTDPSKLGVAVAGELPSTGDQPILLFIHGTASNSTGSFGELAGTPEWTRLREIYKDRIYSLEHRTLSVSPLQNALDALDHLPRGAKLHLVTHSRGGLVGELLCLPELTTDLLSEYGGQDREDAVLLEKLGARLRDRNLTIERFVRVACPSRGTLLASGRLDTYLSAVLNLLGLLPILHNPFYYAFKASLQSLIALKASAEVVPGLEAQRPESPFIHLLNRADIESKADLGVIAGNAFGGGIFSDLLAYAGGAFFWKKHDFVVNTDAMYGGLARGSRGYYFDDSGDNVCHFHYFKNKSSREQLLAWLDPKKPWPGGGFAKLAFRNSGLIFPSLRAEDPNSPLLIVVPGLLQTELSENSDRVWLNIRNLTPGALNRLALDKTVTTDSLLPNHLDEFANDLSSMYHVLGFPYDWRQPVADTIQNLAEVAEARLTESKRPIHFVGLGSGGIVLAELASGHANLWKQILDRDGRAVLLGSPMHATAFARKLMDGKHKLHRLLALVERRRPEEIAAFFAGFPGIKDIATWTPVADLQDRVLCIAEPSGEPQIKMPVRYADALTGNLPDRPDVLATLKIFLNSGKIMGLSEQPLKWEPALDTPLLYPLEKDLANAALDAEDAPAVEKIRIKASIKHGHLSTARFPVIVGHYRGDNIISAERALDKQLGGKLLENFHLDLYPGEEGTTEVIEAPDAQPPGALVIGLGEVGEVSLGRVRRGVTTVVLRYALHRLRHNPQPGPVRLGISALLVGTYGGNALTVRESVTAVMEGVIQANLALKERDLWKSVGIGQVQFVELYGDAARLAADSLREFASQLQKFELVAIEVPNKAVEEDKSGRATRPASPYEAGWWMRLTISKDSARDSLQFTLATDRARAESAEGPCTVNELDRLTAPEIASTRYDENACEILFHYALPPGIRERLRDKVNVVLQLDPTSAKYPWELIGARAGGMIRQFAAVNPPRNRTSRSRNALVIGNPKTANGPDLPHAEEEAKEIGALLKTSWGEAVKVLAGEDAQYREVLRRLLDGNRVVHIAAHGYYKSPSGETGVDLGAGMQLRATHLKALDLLPEVVFLNCCYAGRIDDGAPASLAEALIREGVKVVVAAGWAVDDQAARLFAKRFYSLLMGGDSFGEAVRQARAEVYEQFPKGNSWAAYQCYGNQGYVLETQQEQDPKPTTSLEMIDRVRNIAAQASGAKGKSVDELTGALDALVTQADDEWKTGQLLAEIAAAYGALGLFEKAQAFYRKALADPTALVPVQAVEQLINLEDRYADQLDDTAKHQELVADAAQKLNLLLQLFGPTSERLSLLGGLHKRAAIWAKRHNEDTESAIQLKLARDSYRSAFNLSGNSYPAMNVAALQLVIGELNSDELGKLIEEATRLSMEEALATGLIWPIVGQSDGLLLKTLFEGKQNDPEQCKIVLEQYRTNTRTATPREMGSVLGQVKFLKLMLSEAKFPGVGQLLNTLLTQLSP